MLLDRCGCDCAGFLPPFSWPHHLNSMSLYRALTGQVDPICQGSNLSRASNKSGRRVYKGMGIGNYMCVRSQGA